ncbi:Uu.00g039380.m01.CDS01 [Anthostomella pinea]|uniref:Uu.00g039380.m01.CDS01 n=1 Tax=Anthostomella pinea TaxID=933095 RepID=A0AAI8VAZ1_9PEZI|nr:Uu.00g039380.m01.CDS01 [Anthostomella pinea]
MSTASRKSYLNRRIDSAQSVHGSRSRAGSSARALAVSHDDAYTYALRVAYLHYLLQPKAKRKQWVPAPKPLPRSHTSNISDLVKEFVPGNSTSVKLPNGFRGPLEKRMERVIMGLEKLPGFNDAAVKKTFAQAYNAFTDQGFRKSIDKERKVEPLVLIFFSAATKACMLGHERSDDSWKLLVDRHVALFVRLITNILRDQGNDRDKPELMSRLSTLENKLLTNDQNLFVDTGQDSGKSIEVVVPLSYDVKDMPMVQAVARVFGLAHSDVQTHIDAQRPNWTEEAALKDLKSYQHRMNANMGGALQSQDFDIEEAYQEWKKAEAPFLSQMMMEILVAKPELAKKSTGVSAAAEKPLPSSPSAAYAEDQAYSDLGRVLSNPNRTSIYGLDHTLSLGSMSLDDIGSIRSVEEAHYTFIPPDPREFLKVIANYALEFDAMHENGDDEAGPFSKQSLDLLTELCVRWRIPQFTRLVVFIEVAARRFTDTLFTVIDLDTAFDLVKSSPPEKELKKPPPIYLYAESLATIERSRWTISDYAVWQQTIHTLNDALLRELYDILMHCYEPKPPSAGPPVHVLQNHIFNDPSFSRKEEDALDYTKLLHAGMEEQAANVYRGFLDKEIPQSQQDWDFSHVKKLGNSVVKLCEKIQKRYRNNPEIMGVNPLTVLAETIFPSFEDDAHDLVKRIVQVAQDRDEELPLQDGFDLYKDLVEIRRIHRTSLPNNPFTFDVEELLIGFVWRWIHNAEERAEEFVEQAIKQDQFQVRSQGPGHISLDAERHSHSIIDMFQLFHQTSDQVFQLEWDNDVHHARFMTALSKIFANSIARYCELVDQRFMKEMDTPRANEKEAAAVAQTTQGRFMQYAKDALNTKEKIEPFQFYPESLVKLNNIEWAMQELDKLERSMNVDACAAMLEKVDGPRKQVRRPAKYVFTIKIVEAEEIKACDPNGTSDPYVVLVDEYQKRLHKTRIVMRTLSPRWDESVDVTVSGALNVVATIWDYDTFGDHDFVGRTSLKLDPIHFSDYLPREFWLDLDTQGRILMRVSMEGERDDIQFYFGKAFRHLKRTERDMVRKITDKLSRHINASLSHDALRALLGRNLTSQVNSFFKRASTLPMITDEEVENALQSLFSYFDENFSTMKHTLTDATMVAVMTRLWKEVLMAIEALVVPPLSEKPSSQRPLNQRELDVVYKWLKLLYGFFNAQDEDGEVLGVPAEVLKSPKYHELNTLNFFYFDSTDNLIRTSERMAAATAQRQQQQLQSQMTSNRLSAPPSLGPSYSAGPAFASMGTIRRGKSIMMSRNLGTMRRAKEEKRKEAQADPSDDMILRILRMRPEAAGYLKERHRQKERMQAAATAAMIVKQSVSQGWNSGGGGFGRGGVPRR